MLEFKAAMGVKTAAEANGDRIQEKGEAKACCFLVVYRLIDIRRHLDNAGGIASARASYFNGDIQKVT